MRFRGGLWQSVSKSDKTVYVISLDEELNCELKVIKPEEKSDLEARVEALEKEVYKNL